MNLLDIPMCRDEYRKLLNQASAMGFRPVVFNNSTRAWIKFLGLDLSPRSWVAAGVKALEEMQEECHQNCLANERHDESFR